MSFWIPKMPNTYRIHATVCSQRERERERDKGLMVRDQYCDYCWGSCHAEEEGEEPTTKSNGYQHPTAITVAQHCYHHNKPPPTTTVHCDRHSGPGQSRHKAQHGFSLLLTGTTGVHSLAMVTNMGQVSWLSSQVV